MSVAMSLASSCFLYECLPPAFSHNLVRKCNTKASKDTLAERLRRRPAKPMGSPRVGSNPTGVVFFQVRAAIASAQEEYKNTCDCSSRGSPGTIEHRGRWQRHGPRTEKRRTQPSTGQPASLILCLSIQTHLALDPRPAREYLQAACAQHRCHPCDPNPDYETTQCIPG